MRHIFSALAAALSFGILCVYCLISIGDEARAADAQRHAEFIVVCEGAAVKPWEDEEGNLYVFLPSYFDWEQTELHVLDGTLYIDGAELETDVSVTGGVRAKPPLCLSYDFPGGR